MAKLPVERQMEILSFIQKQKMIRIEELSEMLEVSESTIRRDLKELEENGNLKRIKGGAMVPETFTKPFNLRVERNKKEKEKIGKAAVKFINKKDIIIIDSGTTTLQLAKQIKEENIVILSNFVDVANEFLSNNNNIKQVILSGGIVRESSHSLIGPPAESFFSGVHADKLFLGAGGLDLDKGLTNANMEEIAVKRAMIKSAKEVILLIDSSKFGDVLLSKITSINNVDKIITDAEVPEEMLEKISKMGVKVHIAGEN